MKRFLKVTAAAMAVTLLVCGISVFASEQNTTADEKTSHFASAGFEGKQGGRKFKLTNEEWAAKQEEFKAALAQKLADGEITQERYEKFLAKPEGGRGEWQKKPAMTNEERAAKQEEFKAALEQKLADGEITQEQYEKFLAQPHSRGFARGGRKPAAKA